MMVPLMTATPVDPYAPVVPAIAPITIAFDDALAAGYDRFGTDPFLVQEITDDERPKYFSRNVAPCRS